MFAFIITVLVIACALLILIVLIQQGRGGGLVDSLSSAESIFGTKTNAFLIKSTSVLAVIFFFTCLGLAFLSIRKNKSLIETNYKPPVSTQATSTPPTTQSAQPITQPATSTQPAPAQPAPPQPTTNQAAPVQAQQTSNTAAQTQK